MTTTEVTLRPRFHRLLPVAALIALTAATAGMFVMTQRLVSDQEDRLLGQRGDAVAALLANAFDSIESSLRVLGGVGTSPDPASSRIFNDSASSLVKNTTVAVGVATERDNDFVVANGVGDGVASGQPLSPDRAAAASRALASGQATSVLTSDARGSRLVLAVPVPSTRAVSYMESIITPKKPAPSTPQSPFHEVKVSLYASTTATPSALVVTTETNPVLSGRVRNVPFKVGQDQWLLAVSPRTPLVGKFAENVRWLVLGGGLLMALLAFAVAETLVRRRAYALTLVEQRTTELQEAMTELRNAQSFLDRLLSALPILVARIGVNDHQLTFVSRNIERLFGHSEDAALSPGFLTRHIHPDDLPYVQAALNRVSSDATEEAIEYRFRHGDGSYRWLSTAGVPELGSFGDTTAILCYGLDVDDRHQAEEAQRKAAEAADSANRSKSEFLSRMSHELRTPLNAVLGFGQLLELDDLTEDQRESVDQILKGGRHLLDLINEVLDISRIETGQIALSPEAVPASEIINEAVDLIRPLAEQRSIQIVVDRSGGSDCYVFADRQRAKQILLNLLSNAVKYNRTRGTVAISCEPSGDACVHIAVADTGRGIAAERLGRLFTPFDRLGAEETDIEGTGIGLALSKRLASAMSGTLTANSTLGQGSTFFLELPHVEGPVERYERLNGNTEPSAASQSPPRRRRVLQIEDNLANVKLVQRVLEQRPDVEMIAAMHGSLGLQLAHEHQPVLILLDLHLPDIGGEQVLRRLRDDPVTASTPVVIVSADATSGQAQRLLAAGATAYLTKPIDVRQLLDVLDEALSEVPEPEAEQVPPEPTRARTPALLARDDGVDVTE
jgi:PAS domain S-box-containing protein